MTAVFDTIANAAHGGRRTRRLLLVAFFTVLAVIPLVIYLGYRNYLGLRETKAWSMAGHNPFDRKTTFRPVNPIGGPIQKELLLAIQLAATANGTIILTVQNFENPNTPKNVFTCINDMLKLCWRYSYACAILHSAFCIPQIHSTMLVHKNIPLFDC